MKGFKAKSSTKEYWLLSLKATGITSPIGPLRLFYLRIVAQAKNAALSILFLD